jgi:hypothetical protein
MCAVAIASRGVRHPAVFGITRTFRLRTSSKKPMPELARADSRRTETVTMLAPEALTESVITLGEG